MGCTSDIRLAAWDVDTAAISFKVTKWCFQKVTVGSGMRGLARIPATSGTCQKKTQIRGARNAGTSVHHPFTAKRQLAIVSAAFLAGSYPSLPLAHLKAALPCKFGVQQARLRCAPQQAAPVIISIAIDAPQTAIVRCHLPGAPAGPHRHARKHLVQAAGAACCMQSTRFTFLICSPICTHA